MNVTDAAKLLAIASAFDNRKPNEAQAIVWAESLNGLDAHDCAQAIKDHYKDSTEYLMPAHVVTRARTMMIRRREEQRVAEHLAIMAGPDTSDRTRLAIEGAKTALAEPKVYPKSDRANECPWCKAKPGRPCVIPVVGKVLTTVHPSRLEAA